MIPGIQRSCEGDACDPRPKRVSCVGRELVRRRSSGTHSKDGNNEENPPRDDGTGEKLYEGRTQGKSKKKDERERRRGERMRFITIGSIESHGRTK